MRRAAGGRSDAASARHRARAQTVELVAAHRSRRWPAAHRRLFPGVFGQVTEALVIQGGAPRRDPQLGVGFFLLAGYDPQIEGLRPPAAKHLTKSAGEKAGEAQSGPRARSYYRP